EDGIRDKLVTGVQTCALPIFDEGLERRTERPALDLGVERQDVDSRPQRVDERSRKVADAAQELVHRGHRRRNLDGLQRAASDPRSEERRVGKEWRARVVRYDA